MQHCALAMLDRVHLQSCFPRPKYLQSSLTGFYTKKRRKAGKQKCLLQRGDLRLGHPESCHLGVPGTIVQEAGFEGMKLSWAGG